MKTLLALIVISKALYSIRHQRIEFEKFIYLKCIGYLLISSVHSRVINIALPLGAVLMGCFSLFDSKNRHIKLKMIWSGVLIIGISLLNFQFFARPIQQAYLYYSTQSIDSIDVYSYNNTLENYLFSITASSQIDEWANELRSSKTFTEWNAKETGTNLGYKIILNRGEQTTSIMVSPYDTIGANLFIGNRSISYENDTIVAYIHSIYSNTPVSLTINTSKSAAINIYNTTILDNLWRTILWGNPVSSENFSADAFEIPSYLFFDKYLGSKLNFTVDFKYASIDTDKIIQLPSYLETMLNEQYILSQLDYVNELTRFEPVHTSNTRNTLLNFSIKLDPNEMYYGLYLEDYKTNETILLHTVNSENAQYFILKHPYILLLDEKSPHTYYLMLVNQNIPEKHRYIVKNEHIITRSISLCPQNTQFTYIVDHGDTSSLYLVSDYYRSPKILATGEVTDSLFLSDDYLAFTQIIEDNSLLCIYSLAHQQVIKYIHIPGDITLIDASSNQITFAVQSIEGLNLKEGIFCIDNTLNIYKSSQQD